MMSQLMWSPSQNQIGHSHLHQFIQQANQKYHLALASYSDCHAWSIHSPEEFWSLVWEYTGIISEQTASSVVKAGEHMQKTQWFPGARLNFAENCLRYRDDQQALIFQGESAELTTSFTYEALYDAVASFANGLRQLGIKPGDRVAGLMPNTPETIIAMLGTASLGAIWTSCSPDFGEQGILDRFGQTRPKVLISCAAYTYNHKLIDCVGKIKFLTGKVSSIEHVIISNRIASPDKILTSWIDWAEFLEQYQSEDIEFESVEFQHPLYILYSSGTTGVPKCIVHGTGGTLIQHLKEHQLHCDLHRSDNLFYFTTCGWMMWNWLVSGLATGATLTLYDGSPFANGAHTLCDLIDQQKITIFGTSAKYIAALEKEGARPKESHDLTSLRSILTTGSPLAPESFDYVYQHIKPSVQLSSISGGTDIISCFALGNPILPVHRGQLQCIGLGMDVHVANEQGEPITEQKGELVCCSPFPSMPIGFWQDHSGEKYHNAYFNRFDNQWAHGDFAEITAEGGIIIFGRSDATLNPGGVRIGTAEIYRQVEKIDEVLECIAVGQDWDGDTRIVLFVKLRDNTQLSEDFIQHIKQTIRQSTTPRHVPTKILQVPDIPKTLSGKIVELAVRDTIHGLPVLNTEAIANPEALEFFKNRDELTY